MLSWALFSTLASVSRTEEADGTRVVIRTVPFALRVQTRSETALDHLRWLEKQGYISDLRHERGRAEFFVRRPGDWNPGAFPSRAAEAARLSSNGGQA